jgi:HAD superfamily hydrolase (TIGR01484 family)
MIIFRDNPIIDPFNGKRPRGVFIMDFDGTLLRSDRTFAGPDLAALQRLGDLGIVRVIATGRSLYSFNTVAVDCLAVDFVIFSMGAGVLQFPLAKIVRRVILEPFEVERACAVLKAAHLDFMVHRIIPDNHMFAYFQSNDDNPDYQRRLLHYRQFARPLGEFADGFGPATQLLAVVPTQSARSTLESIRNELPGFNVIQTTSPLDGESTWIEIFPTTVSKSLTAAWLAEELGVDRSRTVAVGNDYNDLDLLEWSASSYVVANAPTDLKSRFPSVASNNDAGVAETVTRWLAQQTEDRA